MRLAMRSATAKKRLGTNNDGRFRCSSTYTDAAAHTATATAEAEATHTTATVAAPATSTNIAKATRTTQATHTATARVVATDAAPHVATATAHHTDMQFLTQLQLHMPTKYFVHRLAVRPSLQCRMRTCQVRRE